MTAEDERTLYEIRLRLADDTRVVRVRHMDADRAVADVTASYPGWVVDTVTRWADGAWLPA